MGPCLCGDPYCRSCFPGRPRLTPAQEKRVDEGLWLIERAAKDIAQYYKRVATEDDVLMLAREIYDAVERVIGPLEEEE